MKSSLFQCSAVAMAIVAMVYFAAVYEPVRLVLLFSKERFMNVGGVGGVGGLANLSGPDKETGDCGARGSTIHGAFKGNFCYESGWKSTPLTPFAWITLGCWVGPLLLACLLQVIMGSNKNVEGARRHAPSERVTVETYRMAGNPAVEPLLDTIDRHARPAIETWVPTIWIGLNILWFLVPLVQFSFGLHGIPDLFAHCVLAVGLAAAHPLSWNAALVVIPVGGIVTRTILHDEKHSSNPKEYWFGWHRLLGYSTIGWAVLHGGCEIIYLASKGERLRQAFDVFQNGESIFYLSGLTVLILFITHAFLAYFRKHVEKAFSSPNQGGTIFRRFHTALAALVLTVAACHWWPFALLFVPATAIQGATWGETLFANTTRLGETAERPQFCAGDLSRRQMAGILGSSILASTLGFLVAWEWRQEYMLSGSANLYISFLFPMLSVVMSLLASSICTILSLVVLHYFSVGGVGDRIVNNNAYGQELSENERETAPLVGNHDDGTYPHNEREV